MNLREFRSILSLNVDKPVAFVLPDGDPIPPHYHVTEVGHVTKRFVDCGGTRRESELCQLQIWVANDTDHRLTAGTLNQILALGAKVLPTDDLSLDVEYEDCSISQYQVAGVDASGFTVLATLRSKHTDCLDKVACGLAGDSCGGEDCCSG